MFPHSRNLIITLSLVATATYAAPSKFDGAWQATMTCPPHKGAEDDAKGYTHELVGKVSDGYLLLTHGNQQEPGWHMLEGSIGPDGDASLRLQGVVNNPKYAIKNAQKGKPYSYLVAARFENSSGTGQRVMGRICTFDFSRR